MFLLHTGMQLIVRAVCWYEAEMLLSTQPERAEESGV
jgi:hypothetical protein